MADLEHDAWYTATPVSGHYGIPKGKTAPRVTVVLQVSEGPCKGTQVKFSNDKWETKNNVFTFNKLTACGWDRNAPNPFNNIASDIAKAAAAGHKVRFQARWNDVNGQQWWSADRIMRDGGAYVPPMEAPTEDANAMMMEALAEANAADAEFRARRAAERGQPAADGGAGPSTCKQELSPGVLCGKPLTQSSDELYRCADGHEDLPF